ncbi:ATPase family associated with various cellular activities (AAA) [Musa troglodytarum]|uniref:ATPase family associated with various cellular activities (AAA) n=1 Tax=Musa troglodytarum TaxID=320322 RepID=A0A9E7H954_9LILI|nr:ATPase family associated with various cellular activities (AAA) [Musa troglodytarum]
MDRGSSRPIALLLPDCHTTNDTFRGIPLRWSSDIGRSSTKASKKQRHLKLSFPRQHRHVVSSFYMPHILKEAESICLMTRERRLYTNTHANDDYRFWCPAPFAHPSNLDTLAIDPTLRDDIRADLLRFVGRQDYYARVGRRWKRSYLLYGPPGTGKTSLVAAIANFLEFDVFHIDLTAVDSNLELHRLLDSTTPGSVIVVEDIDCSLDLGDRMSIIVIEDIDCALDLSDRNEKKELSTAKEAISLSGVLNFVDGLWSSSVGERLMIFTTNHPERLDPALLRPGRMDRQIHLSYCQPAAFRVLARNYLEVGEEHELMAEVDALLKEVNMTPAEIAEIFMGCDGDGTGADAAMQKVVDELRRRRLKEAVSPDDDGQLSGE